MPPRDTDETNIRLTAIENRMEAERLDAAQHRSDLRIVIAAQSEATRVLGDKLTGVEDSLSVVKDVQDDFKKRQIKKELLDDIMNKFKYVVMVVGGVIAGIVGYLQIHAGR